MRRATAQAPAIEIIAADIPKNYIKAACEALGITQEELARRVKVSYRHLNRVALGECEPSYVLAVKIATVLGVKTEQLLPVRVRSRRRTVYVPTVKPKRAGRPRTRGRRPAAAA